MALSRVRVWSAGDILTASDLNTEFNNIVNAFATVVLTPLTANFDIGNFQLLNTRLENFAATQSSSATKIGRAYYQTTENLVHIDTGIVTGGTGANPGPGGIARIPVLQGLQAGDIPMASPFYAGVGLTPGATGFGQLRLGSAFTLMGVNFGATLATYYQLIAGSNVGITYGGSASSPSTVTLSATVPAAGVTIQTRDNVGFASPASASEFYLFSTSIPGGTLGSTKRLHLTYMGTFVLASTQTLTIKLKYGATTIATNTLSDVATAANTTYTLDAFVTAQNATNAQRGLLRWIANDPSTTLSAWATDINRGTATIDSTSAQTLALTATLTAGAAGDSITTDNGMLLLI